MGRNENECDTFVKHITLNNYIQTDVLTPLFLEIVKICQLDTKD